MRGIYLSLASLFTFHGAPKNFVVLRPESLNEIAIGITWGEAERGNLDCISFASFGNPGYCTIKFAFASICVNYETSQCRIGFLIIIVTWQKCKNRAYTEHANEPFGKPKLGSKKLGIISL